MSKPRKIVLLLLMGYTFGLLWGQMRLPLAAIKSLSDYPLLGNMPQLSASNDQLQMWAVQKWYLKRSMKLLDGTGEPRIAADVEWNWGVIARVYSEHHMGPDSWESLDGLYVCVFGAWLRVYTFSHGIT